MNWDALQNGLIITLNIASLFAVGLELTPSRLAGTIRQARPMAIGIALNLLGAPLLAWGLARGAGFPAAAALGFMLCAAAPGGNTGPLLTANARGDVTYAVALVILLSFASLVSVPLLVRMFGGDLAAADFAAHAPVMVGLIAAYQIAPLCLGMGVHRLSPALAGRVAPLARLIGNLSLASVTVLLLARKGDLVLANGVLPLVVMELFVLLMLASGALLGPFRNPQARALALTSCTRNLSLALLLGSKLFQDPATMIAILSYGLIWMCTALPASLWLGRREGAGGPAPERG